MYSLQNKREKAHTDSIWACDWGVLGGTPPEPVEGEELPAPKEEEDIIVTGSLDDTVKIWNYKNGEVEVRFVNFQIIYFIAF